MSTDPALVIPDHTDAVQQNLSRRWTREDGENLFVEYRGKYSKLETEYQAAIALQGSNNIAEAELSNPNGRARLLIRYTGNQTITPGFGGTGAIPEVNEIYAIDVLKDVATAETYQSLSGEEIIEVKRAISDFLSLDEANDLYTFTATQEDLYKRMARGETSYLETGFIIRRTYVTNSKLNVVNLLGTVNSIIAAGTLKASLLADVQSIFDQLPSGEWLVRAPDVSYVNRGKFHVREEYQWAKKWSDLYGGSWVPT